MRTIAILGLTGLLIAATLARPIAAEAASGPSDYDRNVAAAMARMHAAMDLPPTGDPDRDFAAMMILHHQGAIDMAKAMLAHGRDPVLRRLAQGIVVEQAQEIEVMRRALAALPPPSKIAPAPPSSAHHHTQSRVQRPRP